MFVVRRTLTGWQAATAEAISLANNRSVYYTDLRFLNEVTGSASIGCFVARIDITPETQAERLMGRDGLTVDPAAGHLKPFWTITKVSMSGYQTMKNLSQRSWLASASIEKT